VEGRAVDEDIIRELQYVLGVVQYCRVGDEWRM
jgi:hypothetical protein